MKNEIITINGKEFVYSPEKLSYETSVHLNIIEAKENLLLFKKIADSHNFSFLLFYGTLLGAIRENDFIKHDIDIDIVTNDENKLLEIIPDLLKNDFSFIRYEKNKSQKSYTTLYSFRRKSVYIDVYIAYKEKRKYNLLGVLIKKDFIENTIKYNFIDTDFTIPKNYLKILKILYGKTWRIPIENQPGDFKGRKSFISFIRKIIPKKIKNKIKEILSFINITFH